MKDQKRAEFEWRAPVGAWRWLILGSIGVAPYACGGRTDPLDFDGQGGSLANGGSGGRSGSGGGGGVSGVGGVGGSPGTHYGTGGAGAVGGYAGEAGQAGYPGYGGYSGDAGSAGSAAFPSGCYADGTPLEGGFQGCTNGMRHRPALGSCTSHLPSTSVIPTEYLGLADAGVYECFEDTDCTDRPYGHCALGQGGPYCEYGCVTDAECGVGQLCLCGTLIGQCVSTDCYTDDDCGYGLLCGSNAVCYSTQFACQTRRDECAVNSDCPSGNLCELQYEGYSSGISDPSPSYQRRACVPYNCPVIGRPFLVDGAERLALCVERADWSSPEQSAAPSPLRSELRYAIVRGWTEQALMEHASVAAFARFALQLLSLGAPAELVADAATAMQDEIRHARDCFGLARHYSGNDLGPGPLPIEGALEETDLAAVVVNTVREGCIGETVAALEAAEALQHCADAATRAVLERIAAEETRHAELAWRFVAWALESGPRELAARVQETFAEALGELTATAEIGAADRELSRYGLLTPTLRRALRQRVLGDVVAPCAHALLASREQKPASVQHDARV